MFILIKTDFYFYLLQFHIRRRLTASQKNVAASKGKSTPSIISAQGTRKYSVELWNIFCSTMEYSTFYNQ